MNVLIVNIECVGAWRVLIRIRLEMVFANGKLARRSSTRWDHRNSPHDDSATTQIPYLKSFLDHISFRLTDAH